jgi:hypothetical protein
MEITREAFLAFAKAKPEDEAYDPTERYTCAFAQFAGFTPVRPIDSVELGYPGYFDTSAGQFHIPSELELAAYGTSFDGHYGTWTDAVEERQDTDPAFYTWGALAQRLEVLEG